MTKTRLIRIVDYRRLLANIFTVTALATLLPAAWAQGSHFDAENEVPVALVPQTEIPLDPEVSRRTPNNQVDAIKTAINGASDFFDMTLRRVRPEGDKAYDKLKNFRQAWENLRIPTQIAFYADDKSGKNLRETTGMLLMAIEREGISACENRLLRAGYGEANVEFFLGLRFSDAVVAVPSEHTFKSLVDNLGVEHFDPIYRYVADPPSLQYTWIPVPIGGITDDDAETLLSDINAIGEGIAIIAVVLNTMTTRSFTPDEEGLKIAVAAATDIEFHVIDIANRTWIHGVYHHQDDEHIARIGSDDSYISLLEHRCNEEQPAIMSGPHPAMISISWIDLIARIEDRARTDNVVGEDGFALQAIAEEIRSDDTSENDFGFDRRAQQYRRFMKDVAGVRVQIRRDGDGEEVDVLSELEKEGETTEWFDSGSGFYILPNYFLTNYHVIARCDPCEPGAPRQVVRIADLDGKTYQGIVVAFDIRRDLALIEVLDVEEGTARGLRIHGDSPLSLGREVFALGHPRGLEFSTAKGIISSFRRWREGDLRVIQTDAAINPGNSGGPLVTMEGGEVDRVVGINSFSLRASEGLNFAISWPEIRSFLIEEGFRFEDGRVLKERR